MKLIGNCLCVLTLVTVPYLSAQADIGFTKDDLDLVKDACLAGSSFEFKTEADGSISVRNLEGKGKLSINKKDVTTVDLPDADKREEFKDIRKCIKDYLIDNPKSGRGKTDQISPIQLFNSSWEGQGQQTNGETWPIRISLSTQGSSITYDSLSCGGQLVLVSQGARTLEFREKITYGRGKCADQGVLNLDFLSDRAASFRWSYPDGSPGAFGKIFRID